MSRELGEKYILKETIGRGGSGTVYRAYDRHLKQDVAIKQFQGEEADAQWEMDWLKILQHPAFPTILDYVETDGIKYLVMEYIDGTCMLDYIEENGEVSEELAVKWILELAEVLIYLHERNNPVIYRDMKPANIMIDRAGSVRLIDFGTVCYRYQGGEKIHKYAGTRGYAAPEQLEGGAEKRVDEKADIYGLGAVLFHMLTGCNPSMPPFQIQPLRAYNRKLSIGLEKIVERATAKDGSKRYDTVREMKRELKEYRRKDCIREKLGKVAESIYYIGLVAGILIFWWLWAGLEDMRVNMEIASVTAQNRMEEGLVVIAMCLISMCLGRSWWHKWRRRGRYGIYQERNVFLTEKKGMNILQVLIPVVLAVCMLTGKSRAAMEENTLFVNVRNEKGQKLLIRYDAEYALTDTLRLELPLDNFADGERYELRLDCTNRDTGEKHSRIFYLKGLEP